MSTTSCHQSILVLMCLDSWSQLGPVKNKDILRLKVMKIHLRRVGIPSKLALFFPPVAAVRQFDHLTFLLTSHHSQNHFYLFLKQFFWLCLIQPVGYPPWVQVNARSRSRYAKKYLGGYLCRSLAIYIALCKLRPSYGVLYRCHASFARERTGFSDVLSYQTTG